MMKDYMNGLSVKVFRTYNASVTLNRLLFEDTESQDVVSHKADYDRANKEVWTLPHYHVHSALSVLCQNLGTCASTGRLEGSPCNVTECGGSYTCVLGLRIMATSGVQVAILCNHQRAVPKTHEKSMQAMDEKIEKAEENLESLKKDLKLSKAGKPTQDGKNKSADVYALSSLAC